MDLGRTETMNNLLRRREAAEKRLSVSLRRAQLVDSAMTALEQQLTDGGVADPDGSLRSATRALLTVACALSEYDVTLVPAGGEVAVRVRHTQLFGLGATVVDGTEQLNRPLQGMPPSRQQTGSTASAEAPDPSRPPGMPSSGDPPPAAPEPTS
jgi:hypothetical protein